MSRWQSQAFMGEQVAHPGGTGTCLGQRRQTPGGPEELMIRDAASGKLLWVPVADCKLISS